MKVLQIKCPRCGKGAFTKKRDSVFYCPDCKTVHSRLDGAPVQFEYEIAEFRGEGPGKKVFVPFWRLFSNLTISSIESRGQWAQRLFSSGDQNRTGSFFIFVPAIDLPPTRFKSLAQDLTTTPPTYRGLDDFPSQAERRPVELDQSSATELADFLVLSFEAEKPGVLQRISYELRVEHIKLIYLPFYEDESGNLTPAY